MRPPEELLIKPDHNEPTGKLIDVSIEDAGWSFVTLRIHKLTAGTTLQLETGDEEICLVPLVGRFEAHVLDQAYTLDRPGTVFDGKPSALYVPIDSELSLTAISDGEIAVTGSKATRPFPVQFIAPDDIAVEFRGAGNAARQINHIIKPEFAADNLLVVEVFTPSGNWSSFPPHKHDVDDMPRECNIEEIYYYRISHPDGFGLQRLYTADGSFDHAWVIKDGDLLLVTEGYHAFAIAHGYTGYYLNILAGPGDFRSMQPSDDPVHAWVRGSWDDAMNDGITSWSAIDDRQNGQAGKRSI
ncbi:MAG: 5-deoxy-glucuronate isomerase [Thermomicrobiales bacterium]